MNNPFKKKLKVAGNGQKMRPQFGSCPECKAKEKEWCKPGCSLLDLANMARE